MNESVDPWLKINPNHNIIDQGLHLYDSLAVALSFSPELAKFKKAYVTVETKGEYTDGETVCEFNESIMGQVFKPKPNAEVALNIDVEGAEMKVLKKLDFNNKLEGFDKKIYEKIHHPKNLKPVKLSENISFTKSITRLEQISFEKEKYDLVFFDAFAPSKQPDIWSKENFKLIKDAMVSISSSDHHAFSIPLEVNVNSGYNWGEAH